MPTLLIFRNSQGVWTAAPANSGVQYAFQTIEGSQETAVQQLAAAMQQGQEAVVAGAEEVLVIPQGVTAEKVVEVVFNTTDTLTFVNRIIYGTVGEEMLLDDIEAAGAALAAVL